MQNPDYCILHIPKCSLAENSMGSLRVRTMYPNEALLREVDTPGYLTAKANRLRSLINAGADVNTTDTDGNTALHLACVYGNVQHVYVLIQAGAHVNKRDARGKTTLIEAIRCEHYK